MRRTKFTALGAVGALVLGLALPAFADHRIDGTYTLGGWNDPASASKLWVRHTQGNEFDVVREMDGKRQFGTGRLGSTSLQVIFRRQQGASGALAGLGGDGEIVGRAVYRIRPNGDVIGLYRPTGADASAGRRYERGAKGANEAMPTPDSATTPADPADGSGDSGSGGADPDAGALAIQSPASGAYLVGQTLPFQVQPADATLTIDGPATQGADGIQLTGPGQVTLTCRKGGAEATLSLEAVEVELVEVKVLDAVAIADAPAPHFSRSFGASDGATNTPAAIFLGQPLRLELTLKSSRDLSADAQVSLAGELVGEQNGFDQQVSLRGLAGGQKVEVVTTKALDAGVNVNAFDLIVKVAGKDLGQQPRMRVYTTYKAPIKNVDRDQRAPNTLVHFENACRWARGASKNIGQGSDSIAFQFDNQMRHYVHHQDYVSGRTPVVADYPEGAAAPLNYDYLDKSADMGGGDWQARVRNGQRPVSSLYYPPLNVKEPFEDYSNYRNNFGWWVLDNPTHTGGRCNQQASLVAGIAGTLGIEGEILYLHRYGRGKTSGRPVRQYFYSNDSWPAQSATGGGPWNFHGVALLTLEDGSQWIYDGSFSSPPNRKNGTRDWAENAGGPFIHSWGPWLYDDGQGGRVAANDIPDSWQGVQDKQ